MLRADIEKLMKANKLTTIVITYTPDDKLGLLCHLSGGYLMDCYDHRIDRKRDIWGYIDYSIKGQRTYKGFDGCVGKTIKMELTE